MVVLKKRCKLSFHALEPKMMYKYTNWPVYCYQLRNFSIWQCNWFWNFFIREKKKRSRSRDRDRRHRSPGGKSQALFLYTHNKVCMDILEPTCLSICVSFSRQFFLGNYSLGSVIHSKNIQLSCFVCFLTFPFISPLYIIVHIHQTCCFHNYFKVIDLFFSHLNLSSNSLSVLFIKKIYNYYHCFVCQECCHNNY